MPPHIFHALSDDPARWERQFGCMAALFQMFEQHPRVFRRRGAQLSSNTSSAEHSHPKPSSKSSRNHCKDGTDTIASSAQKRSSERGHPAARPSGSSTPATTNKGYPKVQPKASSPQRSKNDSPSILDSSRATATIREPPRKSFDASPECCSSASSRSLPGSPYVGPKTKDGRSQLKMLFDQPRASLDGGREQLMCGVAASRRRDGCFDSVYRDPLDEDAGDGLCKDPLQELKESIRALAKLQQATQEFVDRFESQRLFDDKLGDHMSSTGSASRINASRAHPQCPSDLPGNTINSSEVARTSSFDYTEAVRISQKIQETPARLSLDGREVIPKSVLKLREAMRSRLNVGEMNRSPGQQKKSMSLRSALATKEDFIPPAKDIITTTPSNSSARGHRSSSNVIARLMGLDDIPRPDRVAKPDKPSAEPRLLKDLLKCPPKGDHFGNHVQSRGDCCEGTKEEQTKSCDADVVSKLAKNTEALQKGPILIREDDCKVISVVKKQAKTHQDVNSSRPRPASKHALEVMPSTSPKLERRRAAIAAGVNVLQQHQREYAEQKVEDSSRLERQSVKGFQDEIQRRLRQVVALENSLTERKTLKEIIEAMQLKGLLHAQIKKKPEPGGKKLDYPLEKPSMVKKHEQISRMMLGDDQVAEGQFLTDKSNTSTGGGAGFLGGESTIVVMKPCKTRTLSMETHFSFDVPTLSAAVDVDHALSSPSRPKQGGAAAKVLASGIANNLFRTPIGQRNVANHKHASKVADKSTDDQTERATRSPMSNSKCQNNSKASGKVPIEPAPIPSIRCSSPPARKESPPKQPAAKLGTGSDQHLQVACTDKIKSQSGEHMSALSNRKKRSLENIKKSISKFSAFAATTGVGASKVAGVDKVGKSHRKIRKGESQLLGAQDDAAGTLECAQAGQLQASSHPHGYSTESGLASTEMDCQSRESLHSATRDFADGLPASGGCPFSRLNLSAATTKVAVDLPELSRSNSGRAAPELLSPISVLDNGYEDGADLSPPASTNNDATHDATHELALMAAEEDLKAAAPLNGQFEYVKAILQRAGLLADKEEAVIGAWMGAGCAIRPAVFLELERTWRNSEPPEVENGGQQRRLIFDCIHEILTGKFDGMGACGSGRGLMRAAWRDLQRLTAPLAAPVKCKSKRDRLYLLLQRDLEQSKDAGWTGCSAPTAHISLVLEEAIFQDLLLEVHSEFLQPSLV